MSGSNAPLWRSQHNYDRPASWFVALKQYIQETDVVRLDLSNMGLRTEELAIIFKYLVDSQVLELDLSGNNMRGGMEFLSQLLIKTNIQKLSISSCQLSEIDALYLLQALGKPFYHLESENDLGNTSTKILKDSQKQIFDLDISRNDCSFRKVSNLFISFVVKSHLTVLNLGKCAIFGHDEEARLFISELRNTSLTHLNLDSVFATLVNRNTLLSLFDNLQCTSITHLNLSSNYVGRCSFKNLGDSFRKSKLLDLDLSFNTLDDMHVDILCVALVGTKITTLNLASNRIKGNNNLGCTISKTQIASLDLGGNHIEKMKMFSFPYFLRDSSLVSLKLHDCHLSNEIAVNLMKSLEFSKLAELNVSKNSLKSDSVVALAQVVKGTNITHIDLSQGIYMYQNFSRVLVSFQELLVGSKLTHLDISNNPILFQHLRACAYNQNQSVTEILSRHIVGSQLTHLDLRNNWVMGNNVSSLAPCLKLTAITHLNLACGNICDEGAEALANGLKESSVIDLNLADNVIKNRGATALAHSLSCSNINSLNLTHNRIENDGLQALAELAENSFITVLETSKNPGNRFIVETVIWNNRRIVRQLNTIVVSPFKRIVPETGDNFLRFEDAAVGMSVDQFLDECFHFYKTVVEQPLAARFLVREKSGSFTRDQICTLVFDEFPQQFTMFIASKIEADTSEHICILKRAEELGLEKIVELLLLNRPVYTIDESQGILHPYAYKLLNKYKLPICNLDVEPQGIEKIMKYFTTFGNLEGAADVVKMLQNMTSS